MIKKITLFLLLILLLLLAANNSVLAKKIGSDEDNQVLPEKNGIYSVHGRPDLKLRVFVHPARGDRNSKPTPQPTPTSTIQCGLTDPDSIAVDGVTNWHLPSTFSYRLNPTSVPGSVGSNNLSTIAVNGFKVWTDEIENSVNLTRGTNTTLNKARLDGQNIIAWGRASSGTLGITYTWYYRENGLVAETDTIMNNIYPWSWSSQSTCAYINTYDAQNILTHELGHWFGVNDEYDTSSIDNTMYGYGDKMETKKDTLTTGDKTSIRSLYH